MHPFNAFHFILAIAQMVLQQQLDPILPVVRAQQANMDVVRMALMMLKDHNLMDAMIFQQHHKRHAALQKIKAHAAITQLNTSLTWIMAAAHDSGIVVAVAMKIVSKQMKTAKTHAFSQAEKMYAKYQRFMAHAMAIIRNIITIRIAIFAHHSFMVVAWEIQIDLKHWKNVKNNVLSMNHYVRS